MPNTLTILLTGMSYVPGANKYLEKDLRIIKKLNDGIIKNFFLFNLLDNIINQI